MSSVASKLLVLSAFAATALAHGTVSGFTVDGTYHGGFLLDYYYMKQNGQTPPETAGWYAENLDNGFISPDSYGAPDIICHKNAEAASSSVKVAAGGTIDFHWTAWPESHVGPVITYVAPYDGTIDKATLKWTKIDAGGYDNGEWAAIKLIGNNNTWTTTVPSDLAPGNYVFRHEIIALHSAGNENGAQNYPQCINLEVTGSGTQTPDGVVGTELYTPTDAGILFNVYSTITDYEIPGPALFGSGDTTPTQPTPTAPSSSSTPEPTTVDESPASSSAPYGLSGNNGEVEIEESSTVNTDLLMGKKFSKEWICVTGFGS
ncbi:hypothetical protein CC78DRAFT_554246 [Lojkania enalia]|uniref:Auxiliary Activity family 9 catalytic domain-containing protein n=1 Tax=Lojkania enalia TaxID=147567 RepID=A0A9P4K8K9_9PLEO|nr:hypothetical protein CC78DRAFT_554246 [Didymosphaeria enalia]